MLIYSSLQINLPESVIKRYDHSMTTYEVYIQWITVNGRFREYDRSEWKRFFNKWVIIELGMIISIHIM